MVGLRAAGIILGFLTTFVLGAPATPAQTGPGWSQEDPAGDQFLAGPAPGTPVPPSPATSHTDLRKVQIFGENELGFYLRIVVQELHVASSPAHHVEPGVEFTINFKLTTAPTEFALHLRVYGNWNRPDATGAFEATGALATLYHCPTHVCDSRRLSSLTLEDELNAILVWVPKEDLLDRTYTDDLGFVIRGDLNPGDRLTGLRVVSTNPQLPGPTHVQDQLPNQGELPPYSFEQVTANTKIVAKFSAHTLSRFQQPGISVVDGDSTAIAFRLANLAGAKRIILLDYDIKGPSAAVGLYRPEGPTTVTLQAAERREFTLVLHVASAAEPVDGIRLAIRGSSVAYPGEVAHASSLLVPLQPLGPSTNVLFFHAREGANRLPIQGTGPPPVCNPTLAPCWSGYLSPYETEAGEPTDARISGSYRFSSTTSSVEFRVAMDAPAPSPIKIDRDRPVEIEVVLVSPADAPDLTLKADLVVEDFDRTAIFSAEAVAPSSPQGVAVRLSGLPQLPPDRTLHERPLLALQLTVTPSANPSSTVQGWTRAVEILPKGSHIRLPLAALDEPAKIVGAPLQLSVVGDREEFVNPGEWRLFNVSLLNQGTARERVQLSSSFAIPVEGWTTEIQPGSVFDLDVGDAITVGLLARAPVEAPEGQRATVHLNASTESGFVVGVDLFLTATQFDVPDDRGHYQADEDAARKLVLPPKANTPGPQAATLLLALSLLVLWRPRP